MRPRTPLSPSPFLPLLPDGCRPRESPPQPSAPIPNPFAPGRSQLHPVLGGAAVATLQRDFSLRTAGLSISNRESQILLFLLCKRPRNGLFYPITRESISATV